jgi:TonB-linked SusC/RagA family outer membrane protein
MVEHLPVSINTKTSSVFIHLQIKSMQKKWLMGFPDRESQKKLWKIMKLTIVLLISFMMTLSAANTYSQKTRMDVNLSNATIKGVLGYIEQNSEFVFLYRSEDFNTAKKVDIELKDATINQILDEALHGEKVVYDVYERQIVIRKANELPITTQQTQKREISGTVKDVKGLPIPGVSVVVKSTTIGIITDSDGNYRLSAPTDSKIIVYSFIGMKVQEISLSGKNLINVVMEEEATALDEVVAIGYGTARRKDLTGSVSSVSGSALKDIPVTSAALAIVGRMAGVQVTKTEGSPDADIKIRIRGGGSLTQDNSPLYIVDGFPVDNINDIAPTDIESVDVLKDASSTAIYGARGANGVILITTKRGLEGKGKVSYNSYYGVKNITKTLPVLNPYEYVFWQYELQDAVSVANYFGDFRDISLYKQMEGTNWQNEVFGRTGTSIYNNVSFTGGSKTSNYNVSLTRNDEKEIMVGSGYVRTNLTIKTSNKINNWLTLDLNARLSDYNLTGAGTSTGGRLSSAIQYHPVNGFSDFVDADLANAGSFDTQNQFIINPVKLINDDYRRSKNLLVNISGALTVKFSDNLNYRFEYGNQYVANTNKRFYGINTYESFVYGTQPLASIAKTDTKSYRVANILTYNKKDFLPGNNLNVMIGEELNNSKTEIVNQSAKYFPKYITAESALAMMTLGLADPNVTAINPDNKLSSFFGRVNYDYKGKYLASATFRADGSSKFAPGNQWGYFPSAALAWRISNEQFMTNANKWVSDLKLRASYGESGNNRISDNAWQKSFSVGTGSLFNTGNETTPTTFLVPNSILSNPMLKWETTITRNIGLDFGLFKNRLSGSFEVYRNTTQDLLVKATIPANTGYTSQWQNIGQISNKGLEIVFNGVIIEKKDFRLTASFNIGINKNRIDKLGVTKSWQQSSNWVTSDGPTGDYLVKEGEQVGLMYGYVTDGMYSFDDFTYATGKYTIKPGVPNDLATVGPGFTGPGSLKLKDQNGDGLVNDAFDKVVIGNANPKHTGGFNLTAQIKGFDFSAFFNWVYGNDIYNANKILFTTFQGTRLYKNILNVMNSDSRFVNISRETGAVVTDPTQLADLNKNATMWSATMGKAILHSWAIEDGSFLRLNNLTIGYSLPRSLLSKIKLEQLRIYATVYNLWTWTNYTGYDPEVDTQRATPLTPGVDWNAYPRSRSFNLGINVTF